MKLATIRNGTRDGSLYVVSADLSTMASAGAIAPSLQAALDDWKAVEPRLKALAQDLAQGAAEQVEAFDPERAMAPLPRAYAWIDCGAYLSHLKRARALRGAGMAIDSETEPQVAERIPSHFLGAREPLVRLNDKVGLDIEAEIGVITADVPLGADAETAAQAILLLTLINDTTYRTVLAEKISRERAPAVQGKPFPTMGPIAVTPDELGEAWDGRKPNLPIASYINGALLGAPVTGRDLQFDYGQLIAYCAETRPLAAGTVLAAGAVSNQDSSVGTACIAERRMLQTAAGEQLMGYLEPGDEIVIEIQGPGGPSLFGAIRQRVASLEPSSSSRP